MKRISRKSRSVRLYRYSKGQRVGLTAYSGTRGPPRMQEEIEILEAEHRAEIVVPFPVVDQEDR